MGNMEITRMQIEDIARFICKWGNTNLCIEDMRAGCVRHVENHLVARHHEEAARIFRGNRAISHFECEIRKYMQQHGLAQGKGTGKECVPGNHCAGSTKARCK